MPRNTSEAPPAPAVRLAPTALFAVIVGAFSLVGLPLFHQPGPGWLENPSFLNTRGAAFPDRERPAVTLLFSLVGASGLVGFWLSRRNEASLRDRLALIALRSQRAFRLPEVPAASPDPRHIEILVIRDPLAPEGALRTVVETMPSVTLHCHPGAEGAVAEAQRLKPSLVFLHLDLKDGSAKSVLAGIRGETSLRQTQVIVVGAEAVAGTLESLQKNGADACVAESDQGAVREQIERMAAFKFLAS
jgi:CheY-like chemotaxis protein